MNEYAALGLGIICAGAGGELFVRGTVSLARWARVSPGIIGATVAAFATSSPELSVSLSAALAGQPQIALGDALGSNVVNIALILGAGLMISGIRCPRDSLSRDFPASLLAPAITGVLFLDGELSRLDALLLLSMFIAWLVAAVLEARKQRSFAEAVLGEHRHWLAALWALLGLALLISAGNLIVEGARSIAVSYGIAEFTVGATIVAVGTSVPELATVIVSKLRGHDEVGLGTILGSNIFNGLLIIPMAALIHPITVGWRELAATLAFGIVALVCSYPDRGEFIDRRRGLLLLLIYGGFLTAILQ